MHTEYANYTQQSQDPMLLTLIEKNQKLMDLLSQNEDKENTCRSNRDLCRNKRFKYKYC